MVDGDMVFAVSTKGVKNKEKKQSSLDEICLTAEAMVIKAIKEGVQHARRIKGFPSYNEIITP